jgi:hypothetical protein
MQYTKYVPICRYVIHRVICSVHNSGQIYLQNIFVEVTLNIDMCTCLDLHPFLPLQYHDYEKAMKEGIFILAPTGSRPISCFKCNKVDMGSYTVIVRYHCGGWPEEVNTCFLNSYMVYL